VRVVVMAYQDIGLRLSGRAPRAPRRVALVVTASRLCEREHLVPLGRRPRRKAACPFSDRRPWNAPDVVAAIAGLAPDFLFSFYFREIIGPEVLVWRGGERSICMGRFCRAIGVASGQLGADQRRAGNRCDAPLHGGQADRGDIVAQRAVPIAADDTALSLNRSSARPPALSSRAYPLLAAGTAPRSPQDHARATSFGGRRPRTVGSRGTNPPGDSYDLIRAVTAPYPGAFTTYRGERLFVWWARPLDLGPRVGAPAKWWRFGRARAWWWRPGAGPCCWTACSSPATTSSARTSWPCRRAWSWASDSAATMRVGAA